MSSFKKISDFFNQAKDISIEELEEMISERELYKFAEKSPSFSGNLTTYRNSTSDEFLSLDDPVMDIYSESSTDYTINALTNAQKSSYEHVHKKAKSLIKTEHLEIIKDSDGKIEEDKLLLDPAIIKFALTHLANACNLLKALEGKTIHILTGDEDIHVDIKESNMLHLLGFVSCGILVNGFTHSNNQLDILDYDKYNSANNYDITPTVSTSNIYNTKFRKMFHHYISDPHVSSILDAIIKIVTNPRNKEKILYEAYSNNANKYTEVWDKIAEKTANTTKFLETLITNSLNNVRIYKGETDTFGNNKEKTIIALNLDNVHLSSCMVLGVDNGNLYPESSDYIADASLANFKNDGSKYYPTSYNLLSTTDWRLIDGTEKKFVFVVDTSFNLSINQSNINSVKNSKNQRKEDSILDSYRIKSRNETISEVIDSLTSELEIKLSKNQEVLESDIKNFLDALSSKSDLSDNLPNLLIKYLHNANNTEEARDAYLTIANAGVTNRDMLNIINKCYINKRTSIKKELFKSNPLEFNYSIIRKENNDKVIELNILLNRKEYHFKGSLDEFREKYYYNELLSLLINLEGKINNADIKTKNDALEYLYNINAYNELNALIESSVAELIHEKYLEELKVSDENIYNRLLEIGYIKETNYVRLNNSINEIKENYLKGIVYNNAISNEESIDEDTNNRIYSYVSSLNENDLLSNVLGNNYQKVLNSLNSFDIKLEDKEVMSAYDLTENQYEIAIDILELNLYNELMRNINDDNTTAALKIKLDSIYKYRKAQVIKTDNKLLELKNVG